MIRRGRSTVYRNQQDYTRRFLFFLRPSYNTRISFLKYSYVCCGHYLRAHRDADKDMNTSQTSMDRTDTKETDAQSKHRWNTAARGVRCVYALWKAKKTKSELLRISALLPKSVHPYAFQRQSICPLLQGLACIRHQKCMQTSCALENCQLFSTCGVEPVHFPTSAVPGDDHLFLSFFFVGLLMCYYFIFFLSCMVRDRKSQKCKAKNGFVGFWVVTGFVAFGRVLVSPK